MDRGELGESGRTLVMEEFLRGEEASLLVLTDGERWMLFPPARDHKRAYDGDTGPNTGRVGACAPALAPNHEDALATARRIVHPLLASLPARGIAQSRTLCPGRLLIRSGPRP